MNLLRKITVIILFTACFFFPGTLLFPLLPASFAGEIRPTPKIEKLDEIEIRVGKEDLTVEVADTSLAQLRGLMHRESLDWNKGMLFIYNDSRFRSLWMKNTRIPLSAAFIDENGIILNIVEMKPMREDLHYFSRAKARYILEVNAGWFERNGIKPGARVEF